MRTEIEELRGQLETERAKVKAFRILWEDAEARIKRMKAKGMRDLVIGLNEMKDSPITALDTQPE